MPPKHNNDPHHNVDYVGDHSTCERIRMLLAEAGLDPARVVCVDAPGICTVSAGISSEGFTIEEIDRLTDKAIELAEGAA